MTRTLKSGRRFEFRAGRLQAATYGDDPLHIFRKFDATGDGVLDVPELTKMIRLELKISGSELPDDLVVAFVRAIDDDGSMTLSIDELADFVQYGMDTFYADHEETEAKSQAGGHKKGLGWGERAANPACMTVDPGPGDDEASASASGEAEAGGPTWEQVAARVAPGELALNVLKLAARELSPPCRGRRPHS